MARAGQRIIASTGVMTRLRVSHVCNPLVGHSGMQATAGGSTEDTGFVPVVSNPAMNSVATWPINSSSVMGLPAREKTTQPRLTCEGTVRHAGPITLGPAQRPVLEVLTLHAALPFTAGMHAGKPVCRTRLLAWRAPWNIDKPQERVASAQSPQPQAPRAAGRRAARPCAGP
jgi:hypothetical protein